MEKEITVAKVGSSSLVNPNTLEVYEENFKNIAEQMKCITRGILVSSGGFLMGKSLGYQGNPSTTASAGWVEVMNQWNKYFGSIQPQLLATEKDFHPLSETELAENQKALENNQPIPHEPRFTIIAENILDVHGHGNTLITNQQDMSSRFGLAPEILTFDPRGNVKFHGDNDFYAATIAIQLLKERTTQKANLIILSGKKKGLLDEKGNTVPTETIEGMKQRIDESTGGGRKGSNGLRTKGLALITAAKEGVRTYIGSAHDITAILQASAKQNRESITQIVHGNLIQI